MEEGLEPRDPESSDLLKICAALNKAGVRIPFASAELLLRTKQTVREKDEIDRLYLKRILSNPNH
ncbi:MAG: hypothetical protein GVY36_10650 [Verrucomicrobia bacterium]|jgi:hypothetical protein|nr:hypothetical protein [Verrucomicrobiota bacterium]